MSAEFSPVRRGPNPLRGRPRPGPGEWGAVASSAGSLGWIIYDGQCPSCRGWAARWGPIWTRRGFVLAAFHEAWVRHVPELEVCGEPDEMKLLLPDGRCLGGVDALGYLCRRIWWLWPVGLLLGIPAIRALSGVVYRVWARHRFRDTVACELHPPESPRAAEPIRSRGPSEGKTVPPPDRSPGPAAPG
jgi:predicted DCC family thiol-disulfide oxidoreductase YuxK